MPFLKRINLKDSVYFITTNTFKRKKIFKDDQVYKMFIRILSKCQKKYRFTLYGYVIMPDHVHLLIKPDESYTISAVMQKIKSIFAKEFKITINNRVVASLARSGDNKTVAYADMVEYYHPVWQKSFYDHIVRNKKDFIEKLNYILQNPIRAGLAVSADKSKWSSYNNFK